MATWKKVLVSGSAIDGTTLNIDGAVTLNNNFSTGDSTNSVLVLDAGTVKVVDQSNIAGITTSTLRITGSDATNDAINAANSESIVFSGDITTTIGTGTDTNGSPSTTIALNLPSGIVSASQITGDGTDAISTAISGAFASSSNAILNTIAATTASVTANSSSIIELENLQAGLLLGSASFALSESIVGTTNEIKVTGNGAQGITIGLADDVHIQGDVEITGSLIVSESLTANSLTLLGLSLIDNQTAVISGSNQFGDALTDTHGFSGSVAVVGSISSSQVPQDNDLSVLDLIGTTAVHGGFSNAGTLVQDEISGSFTEASNSIAQDILNIQVNEAAGIAINTNSDSDAAFSIGVNGTASFEAQGTGLTVDNASGVVTYTINPTTLVNSVGGSNQIVSSSTQIDELGFLQVTGDNVISSSIQLNLPISGAIDAATGSLLAGSGIISGAAQLPAGLVSNSIASSTQGIINFPGQGNVTVQDLGTSGNPTFNNLTVGGNLTVQGNTTSVSTTNLEVEDQFILLNSHSGAVTTADKDAGIIADFGGGSGSAFIYDAARKAWGVLGADHAGAADTFLASNAVSSDGGGIVNATHIVTVVSESTLNPVNGSAPVYGDSTQKSDLGNMHVNSTDGAIWIYS